MRKVLLLTDRDHQHHVVLVTHDGSGPAVEFDGGVLLPPDAEEYSLLCGQCNVRLMEGEDFLVDEREDWQVAHGSV